MTEEKFKEIFETTKAFWEGDNAYKGLEIISKYTDNIINGAEHDIIYSEKTRKLIEKGITEEDCKKLRKLNWLIEDDYLACFV